MLLVFWVRLLLKGCVGGGLCYSHLFVNLFLSFDMFFSCSDGCIYASLDLHRSGFYIPVLAQESLSCINISYRKWK